MENEMTIENNPKFWVSNQIGYSDWPDFGDGNNIKHNKNHKIACVYQIWGTEGYIPYLYHSIISQIMYTDIEEMADIFIFTDPARYVYTSWLFRNILGPDSIIEVDSTNAIKYMIPCQPILQNYEIISFIDADMFFWSPITKKYPFYTNIERYIKENTNTILLLGMDPTPASKVLYDRKDTLCPNISNDNYIKLLTDGSGMSMEDYADWMLNDKWKMSGIFIYDNHIFKDPEYYKYAMMHTEIGQLCDETVWNSWIKAKQIETLDVSLGIPYYYSLELDDTINTYIEENPNLYMLHPIVGDRVINKHAVELLNKIKQDFKEYGKK
jgi:hypothetical protein